MVYSKEIPQDMVSYQEIKENTAVERNTTLVVWISMGEEKGVVPTIKGLSQEEAQKLLEEAGFTNIRIQESQEPGVYLSVLDISKEQGSQVPLDEEIVITVCMNQESQEGDASTKVTVPDLMEMTREEAEKAIADAGLKVSWIEETSDEPEGTLLGQSPEAGQEVNKDSYVEVRISKGAEKMYMPNVQLLTEQEARDILEEMGLSVSDVTQQYSDSVERGKVISQSIAQDTEVKKGDSVSLVISRGKDPAKATTSPPRQTQAPAAQTPAATQPPQTQPVTQPPTQTLPPETEPPTTQAPVTTPAPTTTAPPETETPPLLPF